MVAHQNRFIDDVDLSMSTSLTHLLDRHEREVDLEEVHIINILLIIVRLNSLNLSNLNLDYVFLI